MDQGGSQTPAALQGLQSGVLGEVGGGSLVTSSHLQLPLQLYRL